MLLYFTAILVTLLVQDSVHRFVQEGIPLSEFVLLRAYRYNANVCPHFPEVVGVSGQGLYAKYPTVNSESLWYHQVSPAALCSQGAQG